MADGQERVAATSHEDALMKLYDLAMDHRSEWMHFHEIAMSDPFEAERAALTLCDEMQKIVVDAGVKRGHEWRPYV